MSSERQNQPLPGDPVSAAPQRWSEDRNDRVSPKVPMGHRRAILILVLIRVVPSLVRSWRTVSTDDAYVNGRVTFVAPRVAGQVERVLVDDNNRVHKGDLLVQLDKEPYQVKVEIARAAVGCGARRISWSTQARARARWARREASAFNLERAIEDVDNQVALLRSKVAALHRRKRRREGSGGLRARQGAHRHASDLQRAARPPQGSVAGRPGEARGGPPGHLPDSDRARASRKAGGWWRLAQVPPDLDQTFSSVREAQANLNAKPPSSA